MQTNIDSYTVDLARFKGATHGCGVGLTPANLRRIDREVEASRQRPARVIDYANCLDYYR